MPDTIVTGPGDLARIVQAYRDAELHILTLLRDAVGTGSEGHYRRQQAELQRLLRGAERALGRAVALTNAEVEGLLAANYQHAATVAVPGVMPPAVPEEAVQALALETARAVASLRENVLRDVADTYRRVVRTVATRAVISGETRVQRLQQALDLFAKRGITGFTDMAGRRWGIDTYAEMAVRTAVNRSQNEGRRRQYADYGIDLIVTSSHRGSSDLCLPYQGRILAMTGPAGERVVEDQVRGGTTTVTVTATWDEAVAGGYKHPNAILGGDQSIDTLAGALGASKCAYRGPAISVRTAKGNRFTVSPEHPVLTTRGWRTAESLSTGDDLFHATPSDRGTGAHGFAAHVHTDVEDMPTTVEDEFIALELLHGSSRSPACNNFDDDRQFLHGEIDVVMPDHGLPVVPDPHVIKETGEVIFVWPGVQSEPVPGHSLSDLRGCGVRPSVGRPLPNGDAGSDEAATDSGVRCIEHGGYLLGGHAALIERDHLVHGDALVSSLHGGKSVVDEPMPHGRRGDSQNPSDVIDAVPGLTETDRIVEVELLAFDGHAYDFQTVDGVYVLNGIVVHNCRHSETAYIGGTSLPDPVDTDEDDYQAEQHQRYLERGIRSWKKQEAVAMTPERERYARGKVREWQARQRTHLREHEWLTRRYDREQVRVARGGTRDVPAQPSVVVSPFGTGTGVV